MATLHKLDNRETDLRVEGARLGSVLKTVGWTLLGFAILLGIYTFMDVREGTDTILWTVGILAVLGIALIGVGQFRRSHNPL